MERNRKLRLFGALLILTLVPDGWRQTMAQSLNTLGAMDVVDATGKRVGAAAGGFPSSIVSLSVPRVLFEVGGKFLEVGVRTDYFLSNEDLLYASSDCSGTPYLSVQSSEFDKVAISTFAAVNLPGNTLYIPDSGATPFSLSPSSSRSSGEPCTGVSGHSNTVVPAVALINLDTLFTPPFRLVPRVVISQVLPDVASGGGTVRIIGSGFSTGTPQVTFNGTPGTGLQVINDSLLTVTVPGGLPLGPVTVNVTTGAGGSATLPAGPGGFTVGGVQAIPALSEWGTILLAAALLAGGVYFLRGKQNCGAI